MPKSEGLRCATIKETLFLLEEQDGMRKQKSLFVLRLQNHRGQLLRDLERTGVKDIFTCPPTGQARISSKRIFGRCLIVISSPSPVPPLGVLQGSGSGIGGV